MKNTVTVFWGLAFLCGCSSQNNAIWTNPKFSEAPIIRDERPTPPKTFTPSLDLGMIAGDENWQFAWPPDQLPDTISGLKTISTPVDNWMTKQNFSDPVIYKADTGEKIAVWSYQIYDQVPTSQAAIFGPKRFLSIIESANLHGLKCSFVTPIYYDDETISLDLLPFNYRGELYMAFRMDDTAFELYVRSSTEADAKELLLCVAEAIYQKNLQNLPSEAVDQTEI